MQGSERSDPAHPRSRGDHGSPQRSPRTDAGSPPLARGPRGPRGRIDRRRRLTPARAGTTRPSRPPGPGWPTHPRSRGDHSTARRRGTGTRGSPPLARGPPPLVTGFTGLLRLTPARAGTTRRVPRPGPGGRLTPARAGTTTRRCGPSPAPTAHPRSRGDHTFSAASLRAASGSPPLARGPPPRGRRAGNRRWLTPARAGTTTAPSSRTRAPPAHPRSRGDHPARPSGREDENGSPPLARGPQVQDHEPDPETRLTPARAGTTHRAPAQPVRVPAHPRSRGDHRPRA